MEEADQITQRRLDLWNTYHQWFASLEQEGKVRRPVIPPECQHNAHMYYLLLPDFERRQAFIQALREKGIGSVFHYIPLHDSPIGKQFCRASGELNNTRELSERLVRLPLWLGLDQCQVSVIEEVVKAVG